MRLGFALKAQGRNADAERPLRIAAHFAPKNAESWDLLAHCLMLKNKLRAAVECHKRAVSLKPNCAPYWYSYGLTLLQFGQMEEALACNERILAFDPSFAKGYFGKAQALQRIHRISEAIETYDQYFSREPENPEARSSWLYALNNLEHITREDLYEAHVAYGKLVDTKAVPVFHNSKDPSRRIRLAILSPDLREHSCAYFIEPMLQHIDRSKFEIYLYHDHYKEDSWSERLKKYASVWRNFRCQPSHLVEKVIRNDAPDVLIDLAGHIAIFNRLPLFAQRLAPVQITYLGYPNTTGLAAMDYRFVDAITDPEGESDAYATERLIRFAPTAWSYEPPPDPPAPAQRPAEGVIFGCFNSPSKVTDSCLIAWGRLLRSIPGSRLLLKGFGFGKEGIRKHFTERFASCGVTMDRIDLVDRTNSTREHLAQYHKVDIALDTFPYNGTTTTCEALWMGVPVVTLKGDRHAARVGASLLTSIGRTEWIASSVDEYLKIAAQLAANPANLRETKGQIRTEMSNSVLLDHVGQAARFGDAIRRCWIQWCEGCDPGSVAIGAARPVLDGRDPEVQELAPLCSS